VAASTEAVSDLSWLELGGLKGEEAFGETPNAATWTVALPATSPSNTRLGNHWLTNLFTQTRALTLRVELGFAIHHDRMLAVPTQDYRRSDYRVPARPFAGLDAMVNGFIGKYQRRKDVLETLEKDAKSIVAQEGEWKEMSDAVLQRRLLEFRAQIRRGGRDSQKLILPALAAIREAADRTLGLRPFPVQLMGALALHRGYLAEMATGEGKTLTAGLAAVLAGWTKHPCHIITVNDYLVQRDAEWLEPFYHFCGVRVGFVAFWMGQPERLKNYGCDVTYVTSKELLADFLRDRLCLGKLQNPTRRLIRRMVAPDVQTQDGMVLRGLHTAIVDEADSVLIDEAVTPLIIAAPHENQILREAAQIAREMVGVLKLGVDYRSNPRYREIEMTKAGLQKLVDQASHLPGMWRGHDRRLDLVIQALVAREFFHRDQQYIVEDQKIVIVDEFTGRPMPQRTWREGMHQAIEAKENLPISDPTETIARLSFQRFFRCFHQISGMTGTASEAAAELWQVYGLPTITIPPNKPCIRQQLPDRFYLKEEDKWQAIISEIEKVHAAGRPILVGTRSVLASERLGLWLAQRGLDPKILNATRLKEEAELIAMSGEPGRIIIATNMAGRGTDIKLGKGVSASGGLHVIATERHESGRVDRQLFGRAARQGDPGSAQAFICAEDELIRKFLSKPAHKLLVETWKRNLKGKKLIANKALQFAQRRAQALAYKQRKEILRSDLWLDEALSFTGGDTI
jgi:preprotein translocase subunit SecA